MSNENRASVQAGLDLLAERLDPYIAKVLASHLHGLEWTVILSELDKAKGWVAKIYDRRDLQAQLRMMTERLGGLGYPFSDPTRLVSVLGGELRIVRNQWAHNVEFATIDVWRAQDFAVRLLSHIGDTEATATGEDLRNQVFDRLGSNKHPRRRLPSPTHPRGRKTLSLIKASSAGPTAKKRRQLAPSALSSSRGR